MVHELEEGGEGDVGVEDRPGLTPFPKKLPVIIKFDNNVAVFNYILSSCNFEKSVRSHVLKVKIKLWKMIR